MSLELLIEPAFLHSDYLPDVCLFSGRTEGVRQVRLGAPAGLPPQTVVQVKAVPSVAFRQYLLHGWLPPVVWAACILLGVGILAVLFTTGERVFLEGGGGLTCFGSSLIVPLALSISALAVWINWRLELHDVRLSAADDGKYLKMVFPERLQAVHVAWQQAYQAWLAAGCPPSTPKNRDPEEDWADRDVAAGNWDQATDSPKHER